MKLVSISWVRNEADIIETFIRHHAPLVERMVVIDNGSTDGTIDILRSLARERFSLDIRQDPAPCHAQAAALTNLMHELTETARPDLILPLDADEFLTAHGGQDIGNILSMLPQSRVTLLPWRTYVPLPSDDQTETNPVRRLRHRRSKEQPQYYKVLIPHPFHDARYALTAGNHRIRATSGTQPPHTASGDLFLAHFPVRSAPQILRKVTEGLQRLRANPKRQPNEGFHWGEMADKFRRIRELSTHDLTECAIHYGCTGEVRKDIIVLTDPLLSPTPFPPARTAMDGGNTNPGKCASRQAPADPLPSPDR